MYSLENTLQKWGNEMKWKHLREWSNIINKGYKNQSGAAIFIDHFEMTCEAGLLLCQIALWDFLGTNLVAVIFYVYYWRVIMRLFFLLFFIMLKLHKPVLRFEKHTHANKFQIEPKQDTWLPLQISLLWKIVSIVLNPSMTTGNKFYCRYRLESATRKCFRWEI